MTTKGLVSDERTAGEIAGTVGFVVATDAFMSGWGKASRRSIYAIPLMDWDQLDTVRENFNARSEMKRVRVCGRNWWPRMIGGDHLKIASPSTAKPWYE